jgi:predicted DsbA family dithiol-disulfide isomerase
MTAISNDETTQPTVTIEVWSDVVCPWCYIGKRKFETGLAQVVAELAEAGVEVDFDVSYHPYQLDPTAAPGAAGPVIEAYAKKFGGPERAAAIIANVSERAAEVGLEFRMDRALRANTLLAHRVIWLAAQPDSPVEQDTMKERLLKAYFHDGLDIGDPDVLADCAAEVGFDRDEVFEFLSSGRGTDEVRAELDVAGDNGITAVPTYVINGRWAIPGAQEPETFAQMLRKMAEQAVTEQAVTEQAVTEQA